MKLVLQCVYHCHTSNSGLESKWMQIWFFEISYYLLTSCWVLRQVVLRDLMFKRKHCQEGGPVHGTWTGVVKQNGVEMHLKDMKKLESDCTCHWNTTACGTNTWYNACCGPILYLETLPERAGRFITVKYLAWIFSLSQLFSELCFGSS